MEKGLIELYPQSIQINGHKSIWIWRIRKQISPDIRNYIFKRDEGACRYCGKELKSKFHIDHIIPFSKGGADEIENFALACTECNLKKKDKSLKESGMKLIKNDEVCE
jgi:5-methylcytosine-specific restriction endonuclease McrA